MGSPAVWAASAPLRRRGCFVLTYHRVGTNPYGFKSVPTNAFRDQMRWLRDNCTVIHPDQLRDSVSIGATRRPPVLVTFDDAYLDYYSDAYPILHDFRIPAVNFASTHYTDTGEMFWWDVVDVAVDRTRQTSMTLPWGEHQAVTLDGQGRRWLKAESRRHIKSRPDAERSDTMGALFDALRVQPRDLECQRQVMNWDEIRAVTELTTIGAHTHTHPLMSRISEARQVQELRTCRDRIAVETGSTTRLFAYPSGDYTAGVKSVLRSLDFEMAFTTERGVNGPGTDWMAVRRIPGGESTDLLLGKLLAAAYSVAS
jgi:peptidoglycan/xylan/chitin deacetylase (PgdA/CDA1 family)